MGLATSSEQRRNTAAGVREFRGKVIYDFTIYDFGLPEEPACPVSPMPGQNAAQGDSAYRSAQLLGGFGSFFASVAPRHRMPRLGVSALDAGRARGASSFGPK